MNVTKDLGRQGEGECMKIVLTSFENAPHPHPKVKVFEDPDDGEERPDSVFPNN